MANSSRNGVPNSKLSADRVSRACDGDFTTAKCQAIVMN